MKSLQIQAYIVVRKAFHFFPLQSLIFNRTENQRSLLLIGWQRRRHHDHLVSLVDDAAFSRNAQRGQHVVPCDVTLSAISMLSLVTSHSAQ